MIDPRKSRTLLIALMSILLVSCPGAKENHSTPDTLHEDKDGDGVLDKEDLVVLDEDVDLKEEGFRLWYDTIIDNVIVLLVEVDKSYNATLLGIEESNLNGISINKAAKTNQISIGSGFVKSYSPLSPLGLLKVNGEVIQRIKPNGFNSIVGITKDSISITPLKAVNDEMIQKMEGAFQVGPLLVINSQKATIVEKGIAASRGFIGLTKNENYLLGITLQPILLNPLAEFLSEICLTCTNLSGGGDEGIIVNSKSTSPIKAGHTSFRQSSIITFNPKQK